MVDIIGNKDFRDFIRRVRWLSQIFSLVLFQICSICDLGWVSRKATPEELHQREQWSPNPNDISSLDALFHTRLGNFDIVPDLAGEYPTLIQRAQKMNINEHEIWVVHIDELLARLAIPRRQKDIPRVKQLREIQRQLAG